MNVNFFNQNASKLIGIAFLVFIILGCSFASAPVTPSASAESVATKISTATMFVIPTSTSIPSEIFSLENFKEIPPDDILEEVQYSAPGGGGERRICWEQPTKPVVNIVNESMYEFNQELLSPVYLVSCGWNNGERVDLQVQNPKGITFEKSVEVQSPDINQGITSTYIDYAFYPSLDSVEGIYTFTFTGSNGNVKFIVNYQNSPKAGLDYRTGDDADQLILFGFLPNEYLRVFLYRGGKFVAWQEYHANEDGRLAVQIPVNLKEAGAMLAIIGEHSGELHHSLSIFGSMGNVYEVCDGLVPTQLGVGSYAYVSSNPPKSNILRSGPGTSFEMVSKLPPGTVIQVIDGPECADGIIYWKVVGVNKNVEGWTGEGDEESYWLIECGEPENLACPSE